MAEQQKSGNPEGPRGHDGARSTDVVTCADLGTIRDALAADGGSSRLPPVAEERIAVLCGRARALGLRVEELIVQVKRAWRVLPGTARLEALSHRDTRLDRVVTALIAQYYDAPAGGGRRDVAAGPAGRDATGDDGPS